MPPRRLSHNNKFGLNLYTKYYMDVIILYAEHLYPGYQKNLGPYTIASSLRDNGYSVQVIDYSLTQDRAKSSPASADHISLQELIKPFLTKETLWIGLSTTFIPDFDARNDNVFFPSNYVSEQNKSLKERTNQFCNWVRSISPKCQFVSGGSRSHDFRLPNWHIFSGHFDDEIIEFTKWLRDPKSSTWIPQINKQAMGNGNKTFATRPHKWHDSDVIESGESLPIEVARGCIFRCAFCRFNLNGKNKMDYIKDPGVLREEMEENFNRWKITHYTLADDTFNESVYKLNYLNQGCFSRLKNPVKFSAYLRLDLLMAHPEMVELLPAMGLNNAIFGIETLDPRNAKLIGKGKHPLKQLEFLHYLRKKWSNVTLLSAFIFGFPYDTIDTPNMYFDVLGNNSSPLHHSYFKSLHIYSPNELKNPGIRVSPFDLNAAKYGYTFNGMVWHNSISNLTSTYTDSKVMELTEKVRHNPLYRQSMSGFEVNRFLNLNIEHADVDILSRREIFAKYDIPYLTKQRHVEYTQKLGGHAGIRTLSA